MVLFVLIFYLAVIVIPIIAILAIIVKAVYAIEDKKARQALEIARQNIIDERNQILSENHEPEYQLIKPVPISENTIFEEKAIITAFNEYVPLKNTSLKVSQHNDYVTSLRNCLSNFNEELGWDKETDIEKLPALLGVINLDKVFLTGNFKVMYEHFTALSEWKDFIKKARTLKTAKNRRLFYYKRDDIFNDFFNGYDVNCIKSDDYYLYFFPCYIVKINSSGQMLKVITYQQSDEISTDIKNKCTKSTFEQFIAGYNKYIGIFKSETHAAFFKCNFSLTEAEKSEIAKRERIKLIKEFAEKLEAGKTRISNELNAARDEILSGKYSVSGDETEYPTLSDEYSNREEYRLNKAYIDYIISKKRKASVKNHNEAVKKSRKKLADINKALGFPKDKNADKLPEFEAELDAETIDSLYGNFNKLFTYFNEKKEWTSFIKKLENCKITDDSKLLKYNSEADFKDFFNKENIPMIYLDKNTFLALLPCYVVCIQDKIISAIPYEKIRLEVKYTDKKESIKINSNGKVIAKEYKYQKKDGSPDNRYCNNPVIYIVRYFSLSVGWKRYKRTIPCVDAEKVVSLFERYTDIFSDGLNAFILKNVFTKEESDIDLLIEKYKSAEKIKKEKIKKQKALAETQRLEEENNKREEERRKNLEIIKIQKERNAEMLRKKAMETNALKIFGVDSDGENKDKAVEENAVTSDISSESPISVLSKPIITNNVFKVEIKQDGSLNCNELDVVFVDVNKNNISHKRTIKNIAAGEKNTVGIMLLSNIDFTSMKVCFMTVIANGKTIAEIPFEMNISFYSDF